MAGLRESKKQQVKMNILSISRNCFLEYGYEATTVRTIAEKANIGLGTVFNYFPSKADILLAIVMNSINDNESTKLSSPIDVNASASDIVYHHLESIFDKFLVFPPQLMRDFVIALLSVTGNQNKLLQVMVAGDKTIIEDLKNLLETLQRKKMISGDIDPETISDLLFSSCIVDLCQIAFNTNFTKDMLYLNMRNKINYLIG